MTAEAEVSGGLTYVHVARVESSLVTRPEVANLRASPHGLGDVAGT